MKGGWEKYTQSKEWLVSNRAKSDLIINSGQRGQDGRWWFLTKFSKDKMKSLSKLGFQVKDNNDNGYFLVSEPFGEMDNPPKYCINTECKKYQE